MSDQMTESALDQTRYSRLAGLKFLIFMAIFLVAGVVVIFKFDSYFTDFTKIAQCDPEGYERGQYMVTCKGITGIKRYSFGAIYLDIQKDVGERAREADVIVFGNSRTSRSFSTDVIDEYFKEKGLTYVTLAYGGAGYRSAILNTEAMRLKPKIVLINNEMFFSDEISEGFADIVNFPEKYRTRFTFFHAAQSLQKWACEDEIPILYNYYCNGKNSTLWRSAINGRNEWDFTAPDSKQVLIPEGRKMRPGDSFAIVPRANRLVNHENFKESCPVLYLVNSPISSPDLMRATADELGVQSVFQPVDGIYSYDKSHMDRPNSERWAKEFIKALDPALETCLAGRGRTKTEELNLDGQNVDGQTDFETWTTRAGAEIKNKAAVAPDGSRDADVLKLGKAGSGMRKILTKQPIKAGGEMRFGIWLWSDGWARARIQIVRSCSAETPMETFGEIYLVNSTPQRFEVVADFEHDHKCALVQVLGLGENIDLNMWQGQLSYTDPPAKSNPELEP